MSSESKLGGSVENDPNEPTNLSGAHARPTRGPLNSRSASPAEYQTSGMEAALGRLADQTHKPRSRK